MFEHSVRVPRHYKIAANILRKVCTEGGSVKTLLYDNKLRHFRTNLLFALITECIKHAAHIDKIFENCNLLKNEPRLDSWLAKVLVTELLYGKKALPGKSKPELTVLSYKDQIEKYTSDHQDDLKTKETFRRPRYVRVNTNLLTTSDAIRAFQDDGYRFIRCTSGSYDDYLKQIQGLTEEDFVQDYHVKTMFVFAAGTKLHEHELYLENKIILQDKATALAVHLLAPPPGSVVLDMCAAPGMKTTQLAAYMRNEGTIYAVERNEERFKTLQDFVEKTGSKCVKPFLKDSLEIKRGDLDDVEYILLDPSCSGSGMEFSVHNYIEPSRLARLTSLQEKFLKHAMNSFPKAKRIVYSTCSLFPEENERVVTNNVKNSRAKWRVQDVKELLKGQWNNFGSGMYGSMGTRCLYAKPESDLTIGFFLAVLDRDFDKRHNAENANEKETKNRFKGKHESNEDLEPECKKQRNDTDKINQVSDETVKTSKNKNKKEETIEVNVTEMNGEDQSTIVTAETKKSKIKKKKDNQETVVLCEADNNCDVKYTEKHKKKKRKSEPNETEQEEEIIQTEEPIELVKSKKKKKDKHTTELESNEHVNGFENNLNVVDSEKRKKKKKRKTEVSETIPEEEVIPNEGLSEPVKSKKKKYKEPIHEENVNIDIVESSRKKKKKYYENLEVEPF